MKKHSIIFALLISLLAVPSFAQQGTYTPNLHLYKPAPTDPGSVWGPMLDKNFDIIDQKWGAAPSMIYPPAGIAVSLGNAWGSSISPSYYAPYPGAGIPISLGTSGPWGTPITLGTLTNNDLCSLSNTGVFQCTISPSSLQTNLTFSGSLVNNSNTVTLSGDSSSPGNSQYYGTNSSGTRGFYSLPSGTSFEKCRLFGNGAQNIGNTPTLVALGYDTFQVGCSVNTSTYQITPQAAGYYKVVGSVQFYSGAAQIYAFLYKNGSLISQAQGWLGGTGYISVQVSDLIFFNGTSDYVQLYAQDSAGASAVQQGSSILYLDLVGPF
jgi:hypothetical protein